MIRSLALGLCAAAALAGAAAAEPRVTIEGGTLSGMQAEGIVSFKNIPFAAPPVGDLRWRPPQPARPWDGVRDATQYGPACPQPARPDGAGGGVAKVQSEDCLQLNVWVPEGARNAPVMVWIHGGAHRIGSGVFPIYDGAAFARQGVVLVTINYRLGYLGYFAHPALTAEAGPNDPLGNYGMLDQIAALEWVQRNIAAFGGDPSRVTAFGESAGGASLVFLLASERTKGLIHKAIIQSGGGLQRPDDLAAHERKGSAAAALFGAPAGASAADLRAAPVEKVLEAQGGLQGINWGPFIDGRLVREAPWRAYAAGRAADIPLLLGANDNEASVMIALGVPPGMISALAGPRLEELRGLYGAPEEQEFLRQAMGDASFVAPAAWMAAQTAGGAPSYLYHFTYVAERRRGAVPGAAHGSEIPYVFKTWDKLPIPADFITDADRAFADLISSCWASFAAKGAPQCAGGLAWPAYEAKADQLMFFAPQSKAAPQPRRAALDLMLQRFQDFAR